MKKSPGGAEFRRGFLLVLGCLVLSLGAAALVVYFRLPLSVLCLLLIPVFAALPIRPLWVTLGLLAAAALGAGASAWFISSNFLYSLVDIAAMGLVVIFVIAMFRQQQARQRRREQAAAERLRILANYTHHLEFWMRPDGSISYASPSSRQILGVNPAELLQSPAKFFNLVNLEERQRVFDVLVRTRKKNRDVDVIHFRVQNPEKGEQWLECFCHQVYNDRGDYLGKRCTAHNITRQKQALETLKVNLERLSLALEGSEDGVWELDLPRGGVMVFNPAYSTQLGLPSGQAEITLAEFSARIHPDDLPVVQSALKEHINGSTPAYRAEYRLRTWNDEWRWILDRGRTSERLPDGNSLRVVGTHIDITVRKNMEGALTQSENTFRQLTENMREVFWLRDRATRQFIYVSPAFAEVWGRPVEALYQNSNLFMEGIHWEDLGRSYQWQKRLEAGEILNDELRVMQPDGSTRWVWMRSYPVRDTSGEIYRFAGIAEDITGRKQAETDLRESEKRYRDLIEHQGGGVMIIDPNDRIIYANPAGEEIYGVPRGSLSGRNLRDFLDEDHLVTVQGQSNLRRQGIESTFELLITRPDGEKRSLLVTSTPRFDVNNQYLGAIAIFRDNTQRKAKEERLLYTSFHDALTGAYNRAFFDEEVDRLNQGNSLPVSVIMIDVDGLKTVNDDMGHAAGDELLCETVDVLRSSTRSNDSVCRLGGDEFAVLMPATDEKALQNVMNRVFQNVAQHNQKPGRKYPLSFSSGGAICHEAGSLREMVKEADARMYAAKEQKKNQYYINLPLAGRR